MISHHNYRALCTRSILGLWLATLALRSTAAQAQVPVPHEGPASRVTSRPRPDSAPTPPKLPEPEPRAVDALRLELDQMVARLTKGDGQLRPVPGAFRHSPKEQGLDNPSNLRRARESSRPVEPIQNLKLEGKTRFVHIEEPVAVPKSAQALPPSLMPPERTRPAAGASSPTNAEPTPGGNGIRVRGIQLEPDRTPKPSRTARPAPPPGR